MRSSSVVQEQEQRHETISILNQNQTQEQHKSQEPASVAFVGVFYSVLAAILFTHNNETTQVKDKMTGFLVYSVCGVIVLLSSLLYHNRATEWTSRELVKHHTTKGKWRYIISFPFGIAAFLLFFASTKGDMDKTQPEGFWYISGKIFSNIVVILAVLDFYSVRDLYSKWRRDDSSHTLGDAEREHHIDPVIENDQHIPVSIPVSVSDAATQTNDAITGTNNSITSRNTNTPTMFSPKTPIHRGSHLSISTEENQTASNNHEPIPSDEVEHNKLVSYDAKEEEKKEPQQKTRCMRCK